MNGKCLQGFDCGNPYYSNKNSIFRMIEKILMIFFTTFTVLFALFMLYDNQSEPIITDKIMDQQTIT